MTANDPAATANTPTVYFIKDGNSTTGVNQWLLDDRDDNPKTNYTDQELRTFGLTEVDNQFQAKLSDITNPDQVQVILGTHPLGLINQKGH